MVALGSMIADAEIKALPDVKESDRRQHGENNHWQSYQSAAQRSWFAAERQRLGRVFGKVLPLDCPVPAPRRTALIGTK
jgi:hypothetical protein